MGMSFGMMMMMMMMMIMIPSNSSRSGAIIIIIIIIILILILILILLILLIPRALLATTLWHGFSHCWMFSGFPFKCTCQSPSISPRLPWILLQTNLSGEKTQEKIHNYGPKQRTQKQHDIKDHKSFPTYFPYLPRITMDQHPGTLKATLLIPKSR